ncbi:MAG: RluA family pseudouridine synthase [Erysipelotrichaceae bacterium]|nr:RluA family pseudouridine synthase [Erysipelotrichaceae bacterium]
MKELKLMVDIDNVDLRLDYFLALNTPLSRSNIQKLIKDGSITVNGKRSKNAYKTAINDEIKILYEENIISDLKPNDVPLNIIYEDDDLLIINKQKNLVVHPAPGNYDNTIVNGLLYRSKQLSDINGYFRPGIVHRIDKDTSGLLVVAKNNDAHIKLAEQLKDKTMYRKYYALVKGVISNNEGVINAPIGRSIKDRQKMCVTEKNSKEAITEFKVLERYQNSTLLDIKLLTGRTHQIRVHMSYINHPVLNDSKYGGPIFDETGQYLHAYYLSFIHPSTLKRIEFKTDIPEYMKEYIKENGGKYE